MKNNPVLKTVKEGDLVLFHSPGMVSMHGFVPDLYQIARLTNIKLLEADDKYNFEWLEYDADLLYSSVQLPEDSMEPSLNCMAISQIVPSELLDNLVHSFRLFDPRKYPLSKEEVERVVSKYL